LQAIARKSYNMREKMEKARIRKRRRWDCCMLYIYHMERERLEDGRRRRRSWRLLLEVIASSFMEHSLNNFIIHFRSVLDQSITLSLSFKAPCYLCVCERERERNQSLVWWSVYCDGISPKRRIRFLILIVIVFRLVPENKNI